MEAITGVRKNIFLNIQTFAEIIETICKNVIDGESPPVEPEKLVKRCIDRIKHSLLSLD